jgi:hypothetical protein
MPGTLLDRFGGPLMVGAVVDIGIGLPRPELPHSEDIECDLARFTAIQQVSEARFVQHLSQRAVPGPYVAFGQLLREVRPGKHAVTPGEGDRSLAYVRPPLGCELVLTPYARLVLTFAAEGHKFRLSVTDIRLYHDDLKTPDTNAVHALQSLLRRGGGVVIGVGIGRAWGPPGEPEMHWLQANNVYPLERVFWDQPLPARGLSSGYLGRAPGHGPSRIAEPRTRTVRELLNKVVARMNGR